MPALGITHGEDHLGLRVVPHQVFIETAAWPVNGRLITLEESLPIDGLASSGRTPDSRVLEVRKNVNHVIAPGETKLFQGRLERKSASSSQSGADHLDWHTPLTVTTRLRALPLAETSVQSRECPSAMAGCARGVRERIPRASA